MGFLRCYLSTVGLARLNCTESCPLKGPDLSHLLPIWRHSGPTLTSTFLLPVLIRQANPTPNLLLRECQLSSQILSINTYFAAPVANCSHYDLYVVKFFSILKFEFYIGLSFNCTFRLSAVVLSCTYVPW